MTENMNTENITETVETTEVAPVAAAPVETTEPKRRGRKPSYNVEAFIDTYLRIHGEGGSVSDVAAAVEMTAAQVATRALGLRKKGVDLPAFKRGRRPGQTNTGPSKADLRQEVESLKAEVARLQANTAPKKEKRKVERKRPSRAKAAAKATIEPKA